MLEHEGNPVNGPLDGAHGGHVDEGTVHAWLDGQLPADDAARIEAHVASCDACSAVAAEGRGHIAAATRIINALDGVPAKVLPQTRRHVREWQLRIAAAIVVMAVGTAVVLRGSHGSLTSALEERTPAPPVSGLGPQSPPSAYIAPAAPEARKEAAAMSRVKPAPPLAKKVPPNELRAPSSSSSGVSAQQHADREKDLTPSGRADNGRRERQSRLAATDTSEYRDSTRAQPSAQTAPTVSDRATAVPRVTAPPVGLNQAPAPAAVSAPTIENALQAKAAAAGVPTRRITGRVVDADQRGPIPSAQVLVKGTVIGQNTSDSGTFSVSVPADAKTLSVRRIGYLAQNVPIAPGTTDYTIPMQKDVLRLEAQVVTGAATSISSQDAANAMKVAAEPQNAGASGGGMQVTLAGSRCQGQVVRLPSGAPGSADSTLARLTSTPSQVLRQPGFVVQFVPDSTAAPAGSWQPIGRDSALVTLQGLRVIAPVRVGCVDAGR
jgi:hypothetical protein